MNAVVHDRYGPPEVLHLDDVERPTPGDDEVLVKIRATSVTRSDAHLRAGTPFVQRFMSGRASISLRMRYGRRSFSFSRGRS